MKKRLLAMLLSLVLVVSLLPVGALAVDGSGIPDDNVTGDGPMTTNDRSVTFKLNTTQLYKMLMTAANIESCDTTAVDVNDVELLLKVAHPTRTDTPDMWCEGALTAVDEYWTFSDTNRNNTLEPSNIVGIKITYNDDQSVVVSSSNIKLNSDISTTPGVGEDLEWGVTYEISSAIDNKNIVAFYDSDDTGVGEAGVQRLYYAVIVDDNQSVGEDKWPKEPTYISYIFGNWSTEESGGDAFIPSTNVSSDMNVFAQKLSGSDVNAGARIWVMNDNDALKNRYVELYNAQNNASIGINDVDWSTFRIRVNGTSESTNEDYYVSDLTKNEWVEEYSYYLVYNYNAPAETGSQHNDHISYTDIQSMTLFAELVDSEDVCAVNVSKGGAPGEFSTVISGQTAVDDSIWIFTINAPPTKPSDEDLTGLLTSAVKVTCTSSGAGHAAITYNLLPESFTVGEVVYTTAGYTCTVTVNAEEYVAKYGNSHTLAEGEENSKPITLVYNNGWTVQSYTPVNFNVTCNATAPAPELSVVKSVNKATAEVGDVLTYTITITNTGNVTLTGINVSDTLDNGTSLSLYTSPECTDTPVTFIESLVSNETKTLFAKYTVTAADAGKTLTNTATATSGDTKGEDEVEVTVNSQYTITVNVTHGTATSNDALNLSSTSDTLASGTITVNAGDNVTITFDNQEGYALDTVTVNESPDVLTNGTYTFKDVTADHTITVVYAEDKMGGEDDPENTPDGIPDYKQALILFEADDNGTVDPAYKVVNIEEDEFGIYKKEDVKINATATAHEGHVFDYWTDPSGAKLYNQTAALDTTLDVNGGQIYTYTAHFKGAVTDITVDKELTSVNGSAYDGYGTVEVGDVLTYTITVLNTGNTVIGEFTVEDSMWEYDMPIYVNGELAYVNSEDAYTVKNADLEPGGWITITYTYTVTAQDVANGKIDNAATADINGDGMPDAEHEVTTPTGDPSLTVKKTADASTVQVGTPITYTVEVKNDGYSVMKNVVISDTLWTSDTVIEATGDVTGEYDTDESKYYIEKLEPGEYVTLTYTYTPTEAGRLENKVTVTSDGLDIVPDDSVIVEVTPEPTPDEPGISVTKTVSDRTPDVGDTITYTITVKNTGNTVIDEFTVKDSMWEYGMPIYVDGELAYVNSGDSYTVKTADLEPGGSITISYTYTVRNADEGDRITNYVTVTTPGDGPSDGDYVIIDVDDITPIVPDPDDDDTVYVPNWLTTTDHYAYIVGYEDGTIRPQNNITRAEVATIFFRLLTDNARERYWSTTNDFSDVAAESWYNNAISTLSNMGIINGYEDGTFKPNAPITRAEFTAIATRFFDYEAEYDGAFNDVSARAWYADYVQAAVDMGLVDGYPDGGFHPDAYITRAEACTIVNRVLHRVPHEDHLLAESVMNTWPDNPKSAWYYEDMQEATNSHDYDWIRDDGETVEDWTKKLPERDWSALETEWATAYSR